MSRNFNVTAIYVITEQVPVPDHSGNPYTPEVYKAGTICALGEDREWYLYTHRFTDEGDLHSSSWPRINKGLISLFRDYWRVIVHDDHLYLPSDRISPINKSFKAAKKRLIKGTHVKGVV
jgi:hypothetical protein